MDHHAVLFDLDGTLLDTIEDLRDSMNWALARQGCPARTVAECKLFVGDGVEAYARRALPEGRRDAEALARCMADVRADYATRWTRKTRPYDGIPELLDGLTRRGVKMAVLSNKPDDFTRLMVAELLGRWRFHDVRGARDGVPQKPDPAAAIEIAEALAVAPERFLYVGDTNTDMKTGVAAGMFPVGVLWGSREAEELTAHGAKALVESPPDVLDLL